VVDVAASSCFADVDWQHGALQVTGLTTSQPAAVLFVILEFCAHVQLSSSIAAIKMPRSNAPIYQLYVATSCS
jgi:hypothetical protein